MMYVQMGANRAISVRSFAKVNLGLVIGPPGYRADGYHELRTVYQTVAMYDRLKVAVEKKNSVEIEIRCDDPRVPRDATNTCWKAAQLVMQETKSVGKVVVTIDKRLPVQGGLGAASGNAVAVILALEKALKKPLDPIHRMEIAAQVGSDVPLFLIGGTVLGIGHGEQVLPLPDLQPLHIVVATPSVAVSTPQAFLEWDSLFTTPAAIPQKLTALGQSITLDKFSHKAATWLNGGSTATSGVPAVGGDRAEALLLDLVRTGIGNDFERVVFHPFPALRDIKSACC